MPELLLHSLATFEPLITDVLRATDARTVTEIGGEGGTFTSQLIAWAEDVDGTVHCIDPAPSIQLERLAAREERLRLVRSASPAALAELPALDAYVIDGDHNHWTVLGELQALDARIRSAEAPAVVILHDVGWPNARRDAYYAPERLPPEVVHPHASTGGVRPDAPGLDPDGFSPAGRWYYAKQEGGARNGVLTAVEDYVSGNPGVEHHVVDAIFGLGVLFRADARWAPRVRELVSAYQLPLLARMERNRLDLYLEVLRLQAELERRAHIHQTQLEHLRHAVTPEA